MTLTSNLRSARYAPQCELERSMSLWLMSNEVLNIVLLLYGRARCPWWSGCARRRWARAARRPARWPALWRARCPPPPRRAWPPRCAPTAPRAAPTPPTWRAAAPRCWPPRAAWPRECLHLYPHLHLQPPLRRLPGALPRRAAGRRAPPGRVSVCTSAPTPPTWRAAAPRCWPPRAAWPRECLHLYPHLHLQPPLRRLPGALPRRAAGRRAPPGRVSVCTSAPTPPTWRAAAPRCWPPRAAWPRECLHLYPHLHLQPPLRRLPGALPRRAAGRRAPPGRVSVCTCTRTCTCSRPYAAYLARCRAALLAAARRLAA
ncbi:hypothetical protein ACJJTC_004619 [Scirpophaga incertulas]